MSLTVHEAKLIKGQSRERLFLLLPEWSSPNGFDCHKLFSQQRERLQTELHLLFDQAAHCNSKKIVMSTSGMKENNCANFPVEDFTEAFRIALQFAETHNTLDVYICETASPLVFKTFEYIFAQNKVAFRTSKEKDWEVIASEGECFKVSLGYYGEVTLCTTSHGTSLKIKLNVGSILLPKMHKCTEQPLKK